jgi:hypothetical protein
MSGVKMTKNAGVRKEWTDDTWYLVLLQAFHTTLTHSLPKVGSVIQAHFKMKKTTGI